MISGMYLLLFITCHPERSLIIKGQYFARHPKYAMILISIQFEKNAPVATKSYFLMIFWAGSLMSILTLRVALLCFVVVRDDNNFRRITRIYNAPPQCPRIHWLAGTGKESVNNFSLSPTHGCAKTLPLGGGGLLIISMTENEIFLGWQGT